MVENAVPFLTGLPFSHLLMVLGVPKIVAFPCVPGVRRQGGSTAQDIVQVPMPCCPAATSGKPTGAVRLRLGPGSSAPWRA